MQPFISTGCRSLRQSFQVLVIISGVILGVAPLLNPAPAFADDDHRHYDNIPVVSRDWTDVRAMPDGEAQIAQEQRRQGEYFERWQAIHRLLGPQHVSRKGQDILAKRGYGQARLEGDPMGSKAFTGVDTLRVLLVRIGFEANRDSQLTTIAPGGDFNLVPPADPDELIVDPPPHNKAFYEAHLEGLSEYYNYQSGGRLHIEGEVLPTGDNDSYKLSDIADYGPGAGNTWTIESLERLVRDMIVLADEGTAADGSANLSDYDDDSPFTYIIFVHAGSDWQSDINQDSPNDIPTFFVTLGEPQDLPSSGGSLSECSVIPETTSQDGSQGSIAAAFYHEFGHALGLVDVYNTTTGLPQVGIWDLMDSGTNLPVVLGQEEDDGSVSFITAVGVLPPSLGVWNKWFLGWVEMDEVDGRRVDYKLPAVQVPYDQYPLWDAGSGDFETSYPQAIKAGASSREYFLLENRYVPFPDSTSTYTPYNGFFFKRDQSTGVVQYLGGDRAGEDYNTGMYDFFLPAGGVLVWHVNNDRIAENLENNTINAFGDGLRLLEADGIQDIGVLDSYVLGWYGSYRDPFGEDNGFQNVYANAFPSSRLYDRSWSGLSLTDIRQVSHRSSSVMQFKALVSPLAEGFPLELDPVGSDEATAAGGGAGPRALDVQSGTPLIVSNQEILVIADQAPADWTGGDFPASLLAFDRGGEAFLPALDDKPEGAFLALDSPLAGPPVGIPSTTGLDPSLAWATQNGTLGLTDFDGTNTPTGWAVDVADSLVAGPLRLPSTLGTRLVVMASPDGLHLYDLEGAPVGTGLNLAGATGWSGAAWRGTPRLEASVEVSFLFVFLDQGWVLMDLTSGSAEIVEETAFARAIEGDLQTALIKSDHSYRVWAYDDIGLVGAWLVDWPGLVVDMDAPELSQPLVCEPAVADVDGDGNDDLILLTADRILGYQASGAPLRGFPVRFVDLFPLDAETQITGPTVVVDATGDGVNEIFFNTDGGHLIGLDATGRLISETPFLWGDTAGAGFAVGETYPVTRKRLLFMLAEGGYTGAPLDRQYYNGRVAGYELTGTAENRLATSTWLGTSGGSDRSGSQGQARLLGPVAPSFDDMREAFVYPNPVHDDVVTVRFFSNQAGQARFELYTLEGEQVTSETFAVQGGMVHEHRFDCSMARSGIYLCRLVHPGPSGTEIRTMTLAVER